MLLFDDAKKLEKAVGEEAAKVIVETFERYDEKQKLELATKGDLEKVETRLDSKIELVRREIEKVEYRLENKMSQMELKLTMRLGAMLAASVGLITIILRFMLKP